MCISHGSHAMARRFHDGQERPSYPPQGRWERPRLVFHDPEFFGGAATTGANSPHVEALHRAKALATLPKGPSSGPVRSPVGERVLVNKSGGTRWCATPPRHVPAKARLKDAERWAMRRVMR